MKFFTFAAIPILPRASAIFRALGFSKEKTLIKKVQEKDLNIFIEEARRYITVKAHAARMSITNLTDTTVSLENDIRLESQDLAAFLRGSQEVLLMGSTAGQPIMELIEKVSAQGDLTRAVVYNAVASELADEALSWLMVYFRHQLRRENLGLDYRRFSAGYGDLSIEYQKTFWEALKLEQIGIRITEEFFLLPEKSVTALSGIRTIGYERKD
ncbi:MAG TPA: vitamin B12 dependent-methionine synthase activation domain-containing protein [Candidatus Omnitrophota bacterium]|nr:vitamin B12 dependent-methionine synthase activation domain-containing protein [Candidatus Omnitrophota bacterium]